MGTTYRVRLARVPEDHTPATLQRAIERVLAEIDRAANSWRDDSDIARFNAAPPGVWVPVADGLVEIIELARTIHAASDGAFDVTIAPLVAAWGGGPPPMGSGAATGVPPTEAEVAGALACVGMRHVESRGPHHPKGAAVRKRVPHVRLDLSGIAPGFAVDRIGARLVALGSRDHLVELGGEVRAWGRRPDGTPWQVALAIAHLPIDTRTVPLADGEALAVSTLRAGRSPLDPRSGRPPTHAFRQAIVRARSCAVADAWAVACLVRGSVPPADTGTADAAAAFSPPAVELLPTAAPPAATR